MSLDARFSLQRGTFSLSIALQVAAGETLALLGPNGAGKSTTLGVLAGLHAIDHHFDRLEEDHRRAAAIGQRLESHAAVASVASVETNIVIATLPAGRAASEMVEHFLACGVLCSAFGPDKVRWVTHLDFGEDDLQTVLAAIDSWS